VSFIVSLIQQVVSEEKINRLLNKPDQVINYILGMVFGAITHFCSIPIIADLLNSKVPLSSNEFLDCFTTNESIDAVYAMGSIRLESGCRLFCSAINFFVILV